ncbi:hypothetical protein Barb4_00038 [Bacteroidales bacterium Barb4]|nr:hypothetical protein Barb4_00038 [Bacteroidales bacterium Barb4]
MRHIQKLNVTFNIRKGAALNTNRNRQKKKTSNERDGFKSIKAFLSFIQGFYKVGHEEVSCH